MKEEECLFLYAGTYFLKEHFKLRRWVDYEGKNVSSSIIHLDEDLDSPKWDTFRRCIRNDKIFDEQECGYFFCISQRVYWYKFLLPRTFSSQILEEMSKLVAIKVVTENINQCNDHNHNHKQLEKFFFDDGICSRSALELNENAWSLRLVDSLCDCNYSYLQGWKFTFWGTKTDKQEFDDLQKQISGVSITDATIAYLYHGAPDIFINKSSNTFVITEGTDYDLETPKVIENSKQPLPSYQIMNVSMPQKLGEVIAQTHFLASAELLRCGINGDVPPQVETKGLLVDKHTGGYHVELVAYVNDPSNRMPVLVTLKRQNRLGALREELLCEHLKKLIGCASECPTD